MNRKPASTPEGRTVAAAWHRSGTDASGPTEPFKIGTVLLVPHEPRADPLWGWDEAGNVPTDVYAVVTLDGTGRLTRFRLRHVGAIRPMNKEKNRGWTAHAGPEGISQEYKYHGDLLVPSPNSISGNNFVNAIARLQANAALPSPSAQSSGGGGSGRDRDSEGRRGERQERGTGDNENEGKEKERRRESRRGIDRNSRRSHSGSRGEEDPTESEGSSSGEGSEDEEERHDQGMFTSPPARTPRKEKEARRRDRNGDGTGEGSEASSQEEREGTPWKKTKRRRDREKRRASRRGTDTRSSSTSEEPAKRIKAGGRDGMTGARRLQAFSVLSLDGFEIIGPTQSEVVTKSRNIEGYLRVADQAKVQQVEHNLDIDSAAVWHLIRRAMSEAHGGGDTEAFNATSFICEIVDTMCFKDASAMEEFMLLKGFKINDYGGINIRWFEVKEEMKHQYGEEATRQGKLSIITLTGRMEAAMVVLWSRAFIGAMEPLKTLRETQYMSISDGVVRFYVEESVCEWAVDVRQSRLPRRPGYNKRLADGSLEHPMSEPEECARLLKNYMKDVVTRLTQMRHGEVTREGRLQPIPPAPHTAFFAKNGVYHAVLNQDNKKPAANLDAPKTPALTKEVKLTVTPKLEPPAKIRKDKGPCIWQACKAFGMTTREGQGMSGCTASDCKYDHLPGADEYRAGIGREHLQAWPVTKMMKLQVGTHLPSFQPEWAERPGAAEVR